MNSSSSTSETSENAFLFVFMLSFVSLAVCIYLEYFFDAAKIQT